MRSGFRTRAPSSTTSCCGSPLTVWRTPALPPAAAAAAALAPPCCAAASTGSARGRGAPCMSSSSSSRSGADGGTSSSRPGRRGGSSWQQQFGQQRTRPTRAASSASSGSSASSSSSSQPISTRASSSQAASSIQAASTSSCLVTPTGWHPLDSPSIWKGTEEQAVFRQATPYPLSPTWKVILLSDGSVTRHLQLMTNQRVQVECLEMRNIGHQREGLPPQTEHIQGPLVQRQVLLHIPGAPQPSSQAFVYATSWWNADTVDSYLRDRSQPIWVSLSEGRTELYREILQLELGHCPYLEDCFQAQGPFWGRQYLFWHDGKPLTLIYEVFSTALEEFLGSSSASAAP